MKIVTEDQAVCRFNIFATNTPTKGIEVVEHIKTDLDLLWKECFDSELGFTVEQMEFISSQINEIKRTIVSRVELPVMQKIASIKEQALKGLLTDGGHHKQWFLEAILGMLTTEKEWLYLKEKEQWEEGIAP